MPHIRIRTPFVVLGHTLAAALRTAGADVSVIGDTSINELRLVHRPGAAPDAIVSLLRSLEPFSPATADDAPLPDGVDFELQLADKSCPSEVHIRLRAEGEALGARAREELEAVGFGAITVVDGPVLAPRLRHCGGSAFLRQLVRWCAKRLGISVVEESGLLGDEQIELALVDAETAKRPLRSRVAIALRCDDVRTGEAALELLESRGFRVVLTPFDPARANDRFLFRPGPLMSDASRIDANGLTRALRSLLGAAEIDGERWPLMELTDEDDEPEIVLPVARCREGLLRPYAGDAAQRFEVVVRTDSPDRSQPLRAALLAAGFAEVRTERLPMPAFGWSVSYGALGRSSAAALGLREAVRAAQAADATMADARLWEITGESTRRMRRPDREDAESVVVIEAPFALADAQQTDERRALELRRVRVLLRHAPGVDVSQTVSALRAMGVRAVRADEDADPDATVQLGGAHMLAVEALARFAEPTFDTPLAFERVWHERDYDVGLPVRPSASTVTAPTAQRARRRLRGHVPVRAFIEETDRAVRIGDVWLDKRGSSHPLVPSPELGRALVLDDETASTLLHVARAVQLREPCLLEGETSTSKTSSILWLAARLGVPLARLNLHGHTDAGELVGRHLPAPGGGFAWCDGLLLRALREGMWVLLDEVNLAESAVVERIDALLERTPTLVLTEHDHRVFGAGGEPIHSAFRVFATMNPTGYAGRAQLSPAFLDRFRAHRFVRSPGEPAVTAMLRARVDGAQPDVVVDGEAWSGEIDPCPPNAALASVPGIRAALDQIARFHVAADEALRVEGSGLGVSSTAAPTRRALLSVLDLLERSIADGASLPRAMARALDRYYVARVAPGPEREALTRLMEAHGLDGAQDDRPSREGLLEGAESAASGDELAAEEAAQ